MIQRLNRELTTAVQVPEVKEKLRQQGADTVSTTPEQAGERLRAEVAMWARAIRDANIKAD